MKNKYRAKIVVKVLGSLLVVVTILTVTLFHAPVLAELSNYNPQGLRATTIEEVLGLPDEEIDLATAILILSKEWDAGFETEESLEEINRMASELREIIGTEDDPERIVNLISYYLFENEYYAGIGDPFHSGLTEMIEEMALPQVIKNKKGSCVGLSLLYLTLTERLGLPFYGIALPKHIFVRYDNGQKRINIETTDKGMEWNDREYEKKLELSSTYREYDFYYRNLSKKEVIGVFLYNLGTAYCSEGMYDEAIAEYKKVIEINPNDVATHNNLGGAYYDKGMLDEAIAEYKKAIEINPNYVDAHDNLGLAYDEKGMLNEAIAEYKKAIEIDPDYVDAHNNLGVAYYDKGMLDEAIAEWKKAIEIDPNYVNARNNLGIVYYSIGEYELAIEHCDKAIRLGYSVAPELLEVLKPHRIDSDSDVIESSIDGTFEGWDGETVFLLVNGQIWQQSSYAYTYHYAYGPEVLIYKINRRYKMKVENVDKTIYVERIK